MSSARAEKRVAAGLVQHQRRQQRQSPRASRVRRAPRCGSPAASGRGWTGNDLGLAEAAGECGEDRRQRLRPGDDGEPATRLDHGRSAADPALEQPVRHDMGVALQRVRAWRGRRPALKGGFMMAKSKAPSARPAAARALPVSVTSAATQRGAARDAALAGWASVVAAKRAFPARVSTSTTSAAGQRDGDGQAGRTRAGAEIGEPARQRRTARRPPASWRPCRRDGRRRFGCTSQKAPRWKASTVAAGCPCVRPALRRTLSAFLISLAMPASARMRSRLRRSRPRRP